MSRTARVRPMDGLAQASRPSPIHPSGVQPGGMAKTAEPMVVTHSLSRSPSASRR